MRAVVVDHYAVVGGVERCILRTRSSKGWIISPAFIEDEATTEDIVLDGRLKTCLVTLALLKG